MNVERWRQIDALFQEAAELADSERAQFLDERCGDDAELRSEVEALLAADGGGQIEPAIEEALISLAPAAAGSITGQTVGGYRVLELVGQVGMGAVYRARRTGESFEQQVALKVLRGGFHGGDAAARFVAERRILSTLEHPYIARLIDGGSHQGMPYLVMEYAEGGMAIDAYCRERGVDTRGRIKLFRKVCEAVQHAHQRLVVHRDLKPSNILVLPDGSPKLLDFGIAKLLESGPEVEATQTGWRLMTPDYASPEQIKGEPVTVAADVYSLGVVLYELLCGERPYQLRSYSPAELESLVCTAPVPAASSRVENDTRLRRMLEGDLDNILAMALRKEAARRYGSVEQFSEDLRRHLAGHTVIARPDTLAYRAQKFVRRHRVSVALTAALALSVAAGTVLTVREGLRAEKRFSQVRAFAQRVLTDFDLEASKLPGSTRLRQMMVDQSLSYLDSLAGEAGSDPTLQQELAAAYHRIADIQGYPRVPNLGKRDLAVQNHEKGLALEEELVRRHGDNRALRRSRAHGYTRLAELHSSGGDGARAEEYLRRAMALVEPDAPEIYTAAHMQQGRQFVEKGEFEAALASFERARAAAERLSDPALALVASHEASSAARLSGRPGRALEYAGWGTRLLEHKRAAHGREAAFRRREASLLIDQAYALGNPLTANLERPCEAAPLLERSLEIWRELASAQPGAPAPMVVGTATDVILLRAHCGLPVGESYARAAREAMGAFSAGTAELQTALAVAAIREGRVKDGRALLAPYLAPGKETAEALEAAAEAAPAEEAVVLLKRAREVRRPRLEKMHVNVFDERTLQLRNLERAMGLGDQDPALAGEIRKWVGTFPKDGAAPLVERLRGRITPQAK